MNEYVKASVDARKNAIYGYEIRDAKLQKRVDDFFVKLEEFASGYDDVMKFEEELAKSPLSKEYTDLFTVILGGAQTTGEKINEVGQRAKEEIMEDAKHKVRRRAYRSLYDKARDVPLLDKIIDIKQGIDFFKK